MSGAVPAAPYRGALPKPTPETRAFWDATKEKRFVLPWCTSCGKAHFYPRAVCPHCHAATLEWRAASGRGTIYSYVINHKPARGFENRVPYVIAVIELAEGPRMMSNVVLDETPTPENVRIGMAVTVDFLPLTADVTLPVFKPAASS